MTTRAVFSLCGTQEPYLYVEPSAYNLKDTYELLLTGTGIKLSKHFHLFLQIYLSTTPSSRSWHPSSYSIHNERIGGGWLSLVI